MADKYVIWLLATHPIMKIYEVCGGIEGNSGAGTVVGE